MVAQHYRWDFIGLSTDTKPTPETSEKVVDGSTYYTSDDSKLYVWCKDQWYEKEVEGGGGGSTINVVQTTGTSTEDVMSQKAVTDALAEAGGVTVVQTTGTSTTDVMSQDATTKLVYPDISNYPYKMVIGEGSIAGTNKGLAINGIINTGTNGGCIAIGTTDVSQAQIGQSGRASNSIAIGNIASVSWGSNSISIGNQALANSGQNTGNNVALGYSALAGKGTATSTVALGAFAQTSRTGEVNIGTGGQNKGYNSTDYRVLGGVHDGVDAHDAVTVGQINALIDAINTATGSSISHIGS